VETWNFCILGWYGKLTPDENLWKEVVVVSIDGAKITFRKKGNNPNMF